MSYTKQDVEFHSDGFGRDSLPAVNVKVYRSLSDVDFANDVEIPAGLTLDWIEEHLSEERLDALFWSTCENEWEMLQQDAETIYGSGVKVESQGRSGGWACVTGLDEIENWDAVALAKWRKFERWAKQFAHGIPEQMVYSISSNEWEWDQAEQAEDAGVHQDVAPLAIGREST